MIKYLNFHFWTYSSAWDSSLKTDAWVDNVVVTPELATLFLLAAGSLAVLRKICRQSAPV
jgi:hypothetical protein